MTTKYAEFTGTAMRKEFWLLLILVNVLNVLAVTIDGTWGVFAPVWWMPVGPVEWVVFLATLIPLLAVSARRLHARNMSGLWQLLWPVMLVVAFLPDYDEDKIDVKYGGTMK